MTLLYSFIFCGVICLICQVILNNTKLTYGHITCFLVVIGAFLSTFGIYDNFAKFIGVGANLPIISFGNIITRSVYEGYLLNGILGIFTNLLSGVSLGISYTVIISFIVMLVSRPRD